MTTWYSGFHDALRVTFAPEALQVFHAHQQHRFWQSERGGVLFAASVGTYDGRVVVTHASPPHANDRSSRYSLTLNPTRVQGEISAAYARGLHFVGYWHTHPQRAPRLSDQDAQSMLPIVAGSGIDLARVLIVVVGMGRDSVPLDVCAVDKLSARVERLGAIEETTGPMATKEFAA